MSNILNPKLVRIQTEGKISLNKILWSIIAVPACTLWLIIFIPFTRGKALRYRKYKVLGNAWEV